MFAIVHTINVHLVIKTPWKIVFVYKLLLPFGNKSSLTTPGLLPVTHSATNMVKIQYQT